MLQLQACQEAEGQLEEVRAERRLPQAQLEAEVADLQVGQDCNAHCQYDSNCVKKACQAMGTLVHVVAC